MCFPVTSRVYLVLTDWEGVTLRYLNTDPRFSLYSVIGQMTGFTPLPQHAQWVSISAKGNSLDLGVYQSYGDKVGPIKLQINRVDLDTPPRIWYLVPKFLRDKMRRPPRIIYMGEVSPGPLKISGPSLLCWLYNEGQGVKDTNFIFTLEAPLNMPITINKERGGSEEAKPPLSEQPPSNTVFDIQGNGQPMGFGLSAGQINIFCHGAISKKQTSQPIQITAQGLTKAIVMEPEGTLANVSGGGEVQYPGFLLKLGNQNQNVGIVANESDVTFRVATPSFNLGQSAIGDVWAKGLRGTLRIDADSRTLETGDAVSIGGQDLTISTGERRDVVIEGQTKNILHNGVVESKRVWMLIPSDLRTILISIVTTLITFFLTWRIKR